MMCTYRFVSRDLTAAIVLLALIVLTAAPILARDLECRFLADDDTPLTGGELEFCLISSDQDCFVLSGFNRRGEISLDTDRFVDNETYNVIYYDEIGRALYEDMWTFRYSYWEVPRDDFLDMETEQVSPTFHGTNSRKWVFRENREPRDEYIRAKENWLRAQAEREAGLASTLTLGLFYPRFYGAKFHPNDEYATTSKRTLGVSASYRFEPDDQNGSAGRRTYYEATLSFAGSRYYIAQRVAAGEDADVTFFRLQASFGKGRERDGDRLSLGYGATLAWGGIYDGSDVLEYAGRSYGLFGVGAYGRALYNVVSSGGVDFGLIGRLDLIYYPADAGGLGGEDDYWYGLAPMISVGGAIH